MSESAKLNRVSRSASQALAGLRWSPPVACVYRPLEYAWEAHRQYLRRYAAGRKRVLFVGMNPGPFGMAQTGVPFGEVAAVRDWLGICAPVNKPEAEHPRRPVEGFECRRSEVSGRRLWGLFAGRFGDSVSFFKEHYVHNYCPLLFLEASGRNLTPDRLPAVDTSDLYAICDRFLVQVAEILRPEWIIGIGGFAEARALRAAEEWKGRAELRVGRILHPSPASPAANRGWAEAAAAELERLGVWTAAPEAPPMLRR
ncbi:MAG TPA: uracil-DNA glycosylase family protein [Verrucomicrobiales bacterium]|nr:uracil-DNA glycosylase family protein [Verrucomicrobiales bacterium]